MSRFHIHQSESKVYIVVALIGLQIHIQSRCLLNTLLFQGYTLGIALRVGMMGRMVNVGSRAGAGMRYLRLPRFNFQVNHWLHLSMLILGSMLPSLSNASYLEVSNHYFPWLSEGQSFISFYLQNVCQKK